MNEVISYLKMMSDMYKKANVPENFIYSCYEDFVLNNGVDFGQGSEIPKKYKRGQSKMCFMNSFQLADRNNHLVYCEGWALNIIPVHHAWCLDTDTHEVVDPTWSDANTAWYYGVPFNHEYVVKTALSTRVYGVFYNNTNQHPLLTGEDKDWRWNG